MMSASEGGGGSWKSGHSKGGCVNFVVEISSKYGQGWEGVKKSEQFADVINGCSLRARATIRPEPFRRCSGSCHLRRLRRTVA